jgi:hypothetical protein
VNIGRPLWAAVESTLVGDTGRERIRDQAVQLSDMRRWGWAVATGFLIVLVTGLWLLKDFRPERIPAATNVPPRFELEYIRVGGQPANAVVYQPQGSDIIVVWAGKNP